MDDAERGVEPEPISAFKAHAEPVEMWVHADLRCVIYPSPAGAGFNGYVQLPPRHPLHPIAAAPRRGDEDVAGRIRGATGPHGSPPR